MNGAQENPEGQRKPRRIDFHLPIRKEETLRLFVKKAWGVSIPDKQVCPEHTTPWRAFADAYFARHDMAIWHGSRGFAGKSFLLATLGLTEAVTLKGDVNILGGSGLQSKRVHEYMAGHWRRKSAPKQLLLSDPHKMSTMLVWGNSIQALLASQNSVRGPHIPRLRLDEIDEMALEIFEAAMGQPMELGGVRPNTVASSTHHNAIGTMTEVLKRAGEKNWPVYKWCYRETLQPHGWLSPDEIPRKKGVVTSLQWEVEYELGEPSHESRAIMPEAIAVMFDRELGVFDGGVQQYIEIEAPVEGATYATGADWARSPTGRSSSPCGPTCSRCKRGRLHPHGPASMAVYDQAVRRSGEAVSRARLTTTPPASATSSATIINVDAEGVVMVGKQRDELFTDYILSIEKGEIECTLHHVHGERAQVLHGGRSLRRRPSARLPSSPAPWRTRRRKKAG